MQILENIIVVNETKNSYYLGKTKLSKVIPELFLGAEIFSLNPKKHTKACLRYLKYAVNNN